ncbi:MAG TPA: HAMP domain-containing sensor histidine kinase [Actinophytocola sp.]|nr:HAMP domain-containing sensor histidine kinase [Actinophytocola sp.]
MIAIPTPAPGTRLRRWWAGRTLRFRITLVVGIVSLVVLAALSRLGVGLLSHALLDAAEAELRDQGTVVSIRIAGGVPPAEVRGSQIRVVNNAGDPVDNGSRLPLDAGELRRLAAGESVISGGLRELRLWVAVPAVAADGSTWRVVATTDLVGGVTLLARAAIVFLVAALLASALVALAAWGATRAALRPVDRMRVAAAALPPGRRLPVPTARDELRGLAEAINRLLARRDDAVARLERFTGDAAHELRSPVAAIRAQAEVAVAHPQPELVAETLQAVVDESARLSTLLSDLLALARADSGQRPPAQPVDLVAAAAAAISRVTDDAAEQPVLQLVAPTPAQVAATASEVALVLDNLIGNALRYARSVVRVVVLPAAQWVRLVVEDDGPGIPESDRQRIFDRFVRVAPEAGGAGAGLGLALVEALVQGRGGTATAGATPAGGARVEVRWPNAGAAS